MEFEAYSSLAQCHSSSRELNDAERAKLNELIVANKALLTPLDDDLNGLIGDEGVICYTLLIVISTKLSSIYLGFLLLFEMFERNC